MQTLKLSSADKSSFLWQNCNFAKSQYELVSCAKISEKFSRTWKFFLFYCVTDLTDLFLTMRLLKNYFLPTALFILFSSSSIDIICTLIWYTIAWLDKCGRKWLNDDLISLIWNKLIFEKLFSLQILWLFLLLDIL